MAKHQIFISYASRDGGALATLVKKGLTERGYTVLMNDGIDIDIDVGKTIAEAIVNCECFIPLVTDAYGDSRWAVDELRLALAKSSERAKTIMPLVYTTKPWSTELASLLDKYAPIRLEPDRWNATLEHIDRALGDEFKANMLYEKLAEYHAVHHAAKETETLCQLIDLCCSHWDSNDDDRELQYQLCRLLKQLDGISAAYDADGKAIGRRMLDAMDKVEQLLSADNATNSVFFYAFAVRVWYWSWRIRREAVDLWTQADVLCGAIDPYPLDAYVRNQADSVAAFQELFAIVEPTLDEECSADEAEWLRATPQFLLGNVASYVPRQKATVAAAPKRSPDEEILLSVAKFMQEGNKLFDVLQKRGIAGDFLKCLLTSYERLKTYCQIVGATDVAADCVDRIMEIRTLLDAPQEQKSDNEKAEQGIKSLLGFTLNTDEKYDVFISFQDKDIDMAKRIFELSNEHMKKPFWSKRSLPELSASEYANAIYRALDCSTHFVVVLSDLAYLSTDWVKTETSIFHREKTEGRKPASSNFVFVMSDELYHQVIGNNKRDLPIEFRGYQIIKMSEHRNTLMQYIR